MTSLHPVAFFPKDSDYYDRTGSSSAMPEFRSALKERLRRTRDEMPKGAMREVLETYKPHILSRRRRLIEDCVRDLRLNNDHIHIVEQEMRKAIEVRKNMFTYNRKKCWPEASKSSWELMKLTLVCLLCAKWGIV